MVRPSRYHDSWHTYNAYKEWSLRDRKRLKMYVNQGKSYNFIGKMLGRGSWAVEVQARGLGKSSKKKIMRGNNMKQSNSNGMNGKNGICGKKKVKVMRTTNEINSNYKNKRRSIQKKEQQRISKKHGQSTRVKNEYRQRIINGNKQKNVKGKTIILW